MLQHLNCTRWAAIPVTDRMTDRNTNRIPYAFTAHAHRGIIMTCHLRLHHASCVWNLSVAKIQFLNIFSTGRALHLQHRINTTHFFAESTVSVNTTVSQKSATFNKAPTPQLWLNLPYSILNELPLVLCDRIGHMRINVHLTTLKQWKTQHTVILLPLFCLLLYTRCQPEGGRNRCFHHCQKYYRLC